MNKAISDIGKYFFITFISLTITFYIARSKLELLTVFIITSVFTVLFAMDKYNVFDKLVIKPKAPNKQNTM